MRAEAKTDKGRLRDTNEDCIFIDADLGLLILADGMGGHSGGEVASQLAVSTLRASLQPVLASANCEALEQSLRDSIAAADRAILARSLQDPHLHGMGTTLVVGICRPKSICVAHVGDSRAYLLRKGILKQLTQDHSLVAHLLRTGELSTEEARRYPMRNVLVRSVGNRNTADPDIQTLEWGADDCLMLCSDGLTNMVPEGEILKVLLSFKTIADKCDRLIKVANRRGGKDNVSVILATRD